MKKNPRFPDFSQENLDPLLLKKDEIRGLGREILDLTESNPTRLDFHYPKEILHHVLTNEYTWDYAPDPRGLSSARHSIAHYYETRMGWNPGTIHIDDLYITSSTSEAYSFLFRTLTRPGDEVIVEVPGYPLIESIAELDLCAVVEISLKDIGDTILRYSNSSTGTRSNASNTESIEQYWEGKISSKTKLICLVSPNNPTGKYVDSGVWKEIIRIAKIHGLGILIDEVFYDYSVKTESHNLDFSKVEGVDIFLLNGISKIAGLPGWKLGWIYHISKSSHSKEIQERLLWLGDTYLSTHSISQELLPTILDSRFLIQNQIKKRIQRNLATLGELLSTPWSYEYGGAGWYASILNQGMPYPSVEKYAIQLLDEKGIFLHPGSLYKYPEDEPRLLVSLVVCEDVFRRGIEGIILN